MVTENSYFKVFQKKPVTKEPLTLVSASASYLRNIIDGSTSHHHRDPGVSGYKENVNSLEGIKRANDAVFSKQREFQGCVGDKNIFSFTKIFSPFTFRKTDIFCTFTTSHFW